MFCILLQSLCDVWFHLALILNEGVLTLYIDGQEVVHGAKPGWQDYHSKYIIPYSAMHVFNPLAATLINLNFHSIEVVSR